MADHGLTPRELEVLRLIAAGRSNKEIALSLSNLRYAGTPVGVETVNKHVTNILKKLKVTSRTQAATFAVRHGLD